MGTLAPIADVLQSLGADPLALLAEAGLDPQVFADPDHRISLPVHNHLVALAVARTGCRHLGLLVGQRDGLHSIGLAGLLVKYSPDVETALRSFVRYLPTHVHGAGSALTVDGGVATLSWEFHTPHLEATDQVSDGALAVMFNVLRELCGTGWTPIEVRFAHRRPDDVAPFRLFFRTTLRFDAEEYALRFSAEWLRHPVPYADAELRRLLQKEIDALDLRHAADFAEQVRRVLRTALITGHGAAEQVAALFSMHPSTLARRLKAEGLGYRQMVEECRYEMARDMLRHSAMEVSQIAAMLDYADASAFTRAFRRWSGTTPARWRSQLEA